MTRATRPGSIQATVQASFRAVGGLENASADMGVATSTLSYGLEVSEHRPGGVGVNYLDRLGRIDSKAAAPIARHFAQLAGGFFQPLAVVGSTAMDMSLVMKEFSDVLAKHAEAHSDDSEYPGDYTPAEAQAQLKEMDELIEVAVKFRASLASRVVSSDG
ncbi:MAG: hypothetical protein ACRBBO_15370 [Cognatishimia sp.]